MRYCGEQSNHGGIGWLRATLAVHRGLPSRGSSQGSDHHHADILRSGPVLYEVTPSRQKYCAEIFYRSLRKASPFMAGSSHARSFFVEDLG